jgi:hypothetical protein
MNNGEFLARRSYHNQQSKQTHMKLTNKIMLLIALIGLIAQVNLQAAWTLGSGLVIRPGYDYGPTHIRNGIVETIWWTGQASPLNGNPLSTDNIFYERLTNGVISQGPQLVFSPSTSGFDSLYTADPAVVKGSFYNPQDGKSYYYAMYYTGTDNSTNNGCNNRIGVAFSIDRVHWVRYTVPVISPFQYPTTTYGAGQPSVYNGNAAAGLVLFQTDSTTHPTKGFGTQVWSRRTSDGINFSDVTTVTMNGLSISASANCDFAYNAANANFAGAIPLPGRPGDRDSSAVRLAEINAPDLLAGIGTWVVRGDINTALTGDYLNCSPGILRDIYGNDSVVYPTIQVDLTRGNNDTGTWDIWWVAQTP